MDWDDLRYFLATLRAGSTAGAARLLAVRHTTVGRRLSALEASLGVRLFTREANGMQPTPTGLALRPLAEEIEARMGDIARLAEAADNRIEGTVRVTCSEAFSGYLLTRLPQLHAACPGLTVELLAGNRVFDLQAGEADIAIRMVPTETPRLICRRLADAGWSLYAAQAYLAATGRPAAPDALAGHDLIGFDRSMAGSPGATWLAEHVPRAQFALRVNTVSALLQAVEAGAGIAMMPCFLAASRPELVRLFPGLIESRPIWLVHRDDVGKIARVRRVIDFLADRIRADRAFLSGAP